MFNVIFYNISNTETSPQIDSSRTNLKSLTDGTNMFSNTNIKSFDSDLSSLTNGYYMLSHCTALTSFNSDLSSLTDGYYMFNYCNNLTSFTSDLSSLVTGVYMFYDCTKLPSFSSDLSSLKEGTYMFAYCNNLTSFTSNLSSLTNGDWMFNNCYKLIDFDCDSLENLTTGKHMFNSCSKLTSFSADLSSLVNGVQMFRWCNLDAESVMYIADSIKDITAEKQLYIDGTIPYVTYASGKYSLPKGFMSNGNYVYTCDDYDYITNRVKPYTNTIYNSNIGKLTLGINVTNNSSTIKQQLEDFAKAATFDTWSDLKTHFSNKGWTVTFFYGGTGTSIPNTYDLRNREQIIPCPIFAKLVQVEDKDSAEYCTEDASSFYNIDWGHDVTDTTDYTQFDSLEDAMASWNVFPKENIISTEE